MKLQRLVEMIHGDLGGAEQWPVYFTSYLQNTSGEWREVDGVRQPITSVRAEEAEEAAESEVLLVRNSDQPPILLEDLIEEIGRLLPRYIEFTVDSCESPIVLDDGESVRIDVPVVGADVTIRTVAILSFLRQRLQINGCCPVR